MNKKVVEFTNEFGLKDIWTYEGKKVVKTEFNYPKQVINNKKSNMEKTEELFEQIEGLFTEFKEGHEGKTKKAKKEARKALGEIKKLVTEYRKASVEESK